MTKSLCRCKRETTEDGIGRVSWKELLFERGENLWNCRRKGFTTTSSSADETLSHRTSQKDDGDPDNKEKDDGSLQRTNFCSKNILVPVNSTPSSPRRYWQHHLFRCLRPRQAPSVRIIGCTKCFLHYENTESMDKDPNDRPNKPLTDETGETWVQHRRWMMQALENVKQASLQSSQRVNWKDIHQRHQHPQDSSSHPENVKGDFRIRFDLSQMVIDACLEWVTWLFQGPDNPPHHVLSLRDAFEPYWKALRALPQNGQDDTAKKSTRDHLVQTILSNPSKTGIMANIFRQDWTMEQACSNTINAMTAAFETTAVIVFWTIWNLARTEGAWEKCRAEWGAVFPSTDQKSAATKLQNELETLAFIKATATKGQKVDRSGLSYLGRAMMETLRVYPPVWNLPRFLFAENRFAKLDVLWTNQALDRTWNPDCDDTTYFLASFGIGKRHCPGGTAALYAAHKMLRGFVQTFDAPSEYRRDNAVESIYLGPTLCMEGPQYFNVILSKNTD